MLSRPAGRFFFVRKNQFSGGCEIEEPRNRPKFKELNSAGRPRLFFKYLVEVVKV